MQGKPARSFAQLIVRFMKADTVFLLDLTAFEKPDIARHQKTPFTAGYRSQLPRKPITARIVAPRLGRVKNVVLGKQWTYCAAK